MHLDDEPDFYRAVARYDPSGSEAVGLSLEKQPTIPGPADDRHCRPPEILSASPSSRLVNAVDGEFSIVERPAIGISAVSEQLWKVARCSQLQLNTTTRVALLIVLQPKLPLQDVWTKGFDLGDYRRARPSGKGLIALG
jgi:hypothetical protein